jgi:hypothetical protein
MCAGAAAARIRRVREPSALLKSVERNPLEELVAGSPCHPVEERNGE